MPKIFNVNLLGIFAAAVAMFFVGAVFYGLLFSQVWQDARALDVSDLEAQSPLWMAGGFVLELVTAIGIAWVLKLRGSSGMMQAVTTGITLGFLIGVPMAAYEFIYAPVHSVPGFIVDASHRLITFGVGASVLSLFRK
ncbi:MAG: DUF1761 domain-containing protein [Hyphomonas sp.]